MNSLLLNKISTSVDLYEEASKQTALEIEQTIDFEN